jgi:hypothetical protein
MCNAYCVLISQVSLVKLPYVRTLRDEGRPDTPACEGVMETPPVSTIDQSPWGKPSGDGV